MGRTRLTRGPALRLTAAGAVALAAGAALAVLGSAGGPERAAATAATDALALAPSPPAVARACARAAAHDDQPLPCPRELPAVSLGALVVTNDDKRPDGCQTLLELDSGVPNERYRPFHLLIGTRCTPFPLRARRDRWPAAITRVGSRDLGLIGETPEVPGRPGVGGRPVRLTVLRRVQVGGRPGLLLRVRPYPAGGVHGGHVVALWNANGRGYVVSVHFQDDGRPGARARMEEDTTLAVAAASPPSGGG
jgi:hypothetical protein